MTTIRDVANAAGVSTATVSKVLNGIGGQASEETRARVLAAVRATGYVPNTVARNLRRQESTVWSLLLPTIEDPFVTQMARGIEDRALEHGFGVMIGNTDDDPSKENRYLRDALRNRMAGVILTPTSPEVDVSALRSMGIPVVAVIRPLSESTNVDTVLNDTARTSFAATSAFVERGYRRIACLPGLATDFADRERVDGYRRALWEAGIEPDPGLLVYCGYEHRAARAATTELLEYERPEALLVANAVMGIGVLDGVIAAGLDPASDLQLFACDSATWTSTLTPYMGVAHQPAYEFGQTAAQMIIDRVASPERAARTVRLQATIEPSAGMAP